MNHDTWLEQAEVFALDALDGAERTAFEAHLAPGCAPCETHIRDTREALALLPRSLAPLAPSPAIKDALLAHLAGEGQATRSRGAADAPGFIVVRSGAGEWPEVAPGVTVKILFADQALQRTTALVRMAAGSRYAEHSHADAEELYVLEGTCHCAGQLLRVGDYHRAEAGSIHGETSTDDGCLMLVMFSQLNEVLG